MSTFGRTTIGTTPVADWHDYKGVEQFVLTEPGLVSKLTVYVANTAIGHQACAMRGAIYANSAGVPGALLAATNDVSVADNAAAAWVDLPLAAGLALAAGTYWLCLHGSSTATALAWYRDTLGTGRYNADVFVGGSSDPFGATTAWSWIPCIYATYSLPPTVTTTAASEVTSGSLSSGGNVTSDGGDTVTARGVCWNTGAVLPTTADSHTSDGSGTGVFTSAVTGLMPETDYNLRAYATNGAGTAYGDTLVVVSGVRPLPPLPVPTVTVGGEDLTDLIDMPSLLRVGTERGDALCSFDIPLSGENDIPSNALVRDAPVEVTIEGIRRGLYDLVNVSQPQPGDPVLTVEAAGVWDRLHHKEDYCWGGVETRYDVWVQRKPNVSGAVQSSTAFEVDTEGQFRIAVPVGNGVGALQGEEVYLHVGDGMNPATTIRRVTFNLDLTGDGSLDYWVILWTSPWDDTQWEVIDSGAVSTAATAFVDSGDLGTDYARKAIRLGVARTDFSDMPAKAAEQVVQIRDLEVYIGRTTAPRVDQVAAEMWTDVTGLTDVVTESIGSALTQAMVDPFVNGADAMSQMLTKATVPPLCGCIHGQFRCLNRPTAPTDNTRLWIVSEQTTPGLQWDVVPDTAGSKDYVALTYTQIIPTPTTVPSGLPARVYYPSTPPTNSSRVALIEAGTELTDAEAAIAAEQAYHYYHEFVQGQVTIPHYARNGNGQECAVDHIEMWDWVYNVGKADPAEAGPFLISEVSIQDHVAVLTIGATEGYAYESPYRLPTKGKYVGAHRHRKRRRKKISYTTWWQQTHKKKRRLGKDGKLDKTATYPTMPKKHPKFKYVWEKYWQEHEGYYE